jgi:hypothetical protein
MVSNRQEALCPISSRNRPTAWHPVDMELNASNPIEIRLTSWYRVDGKVTAWSPADRETHYLVSSRQLGIQYIDKRPTAW